MKRVSSILISIIMIVTMFSAVSFAGENDELKTVDSQSVSSVKVLDENKTIEGFKAADTAELAGVGTVRFVSAGSKSYTVSWEKVSIPSGGNFYAYAVYDVNTGKVVAATRNQNEVSATISTGKMGYMSEVIVYYLYTDSSHTTTNPGYEEIGRVYVNTIPAACSSKKIDVYTYSDSSVTLGHSYSDSTGATAIQYELRKYSGSKVGTKSSTSTAVFSSKKNTGYKFRARLCIKNPSNGKTYYGAWSGYKYFDKPTVTGVAYSSRKIKTKVKKCTNVKAFKVYISTKKSSGYKLVKTHKVGSKSTYSTTITKCGSSSLKRGKTYYIKTVPVMKNGKTSRIIDYKKALIP